MKRLLPAWIEIFDSIEDGIIISNVSKKARLTFSHTVKVLKLLEDNKYIQTVVKGRTKCIAFTAKGLRMKKKIKEFIEVWREK